MGGPGGLVAAGRVDALSGAYMVAVLPEAEAPSPESRALVLEALIEIDRMLDSLKPQVRTAFLWAQLEGLSCPQIASRLGVSLATAERYVAYRWDVFHPRGLS